MNCEKCGKETGAEWKKLCIDCYRISRREASDRFFVLKCNCGKKICLDSKTEKQTQKDYNSKLLQRFQVTTFEELQKIYKCRTCRENDRLGLSTTEKVSVEPSEVPNFHGLVGYDETIRDINLLQKYGSKAVFVGGYHGLGKSSLVEALAEENNAKCVRFQITELTSEVDILGGLDIKSGEFIYSDFVKNLIKANNQPTKQFYVLLDEFTRGRDEALNVLFPLLAEKKLIINSPYAKNHEIVVNSNVKIFATGNLHDSGQRDIGQAELDRYNVIEVQPIEDIETLKQIIQLKIGNMNSETRDILLSFYLQTWQKYREARILAMSVRTLIECANITKELNKKLLSKSAIKKALQLTYYGTSHAMINPNYARTYQEMIREL